MEITFTPKFAIEDIVVDSDDVCWMVKDILYHTKNEQVVYVLFNPLLGQESDWEGNLKPWEGEEINGTK